MRSSKLFFLLCLMATICWAEIPALVFNISADSTESIFIVDKKYQRLFVVKSPKPQELKVLREFRVTTGKVHGDKSREGDHKTPEGIYYIIDHIPGNKLSSIYGPAAFVLDYPNFVDRLDGRNGSNIWIHGRDTKIEDFITEGCISLENGNLLELAKYIRINKTPVIICDNIKDSFLLDEQGYQLNLKRWREYMEGWASAWQNGELEKYISYYASNFKDEGGRDINRFRNYKADLEKRYAWKSVNIEKITVLSSVQESHIKFIQRYQCPNFYSVGWKTLILIPQGNKWKIVRETFSPIKPRTNTSEFVEEFLQRWLEAWRKKDLTAYASFYSSRFNSDGYDYDSWIKYKSEVFNNTKSISIQYSNLKIDSNKPFTYTVTFDQVYTADGYTDKGQKTLVIEGSPETLKIVKEEWKKVE